MSLNHKEKAIAENEDTGSTAVMKVTENQIIMTSIVPDEIITEKTHVTGIKNLDEEDQESGLTVANAGTIVVITKSKFLKFMDSIFIGDMTQAILKEIDVITNLVEGVVIRVIESTLDGNESQTCTLTSRKKFKLRLFQMLTNMATNYFGMVSSGLVRCRD